MRQTPSSVTATVLTRSVSFRRNRLSPARLIINAGFILASLACLIPLLLVLSISLTSEASVMEHGYRLIPPVFSLGAYQYIFSGASPLPRAYLVTLFVTLVGTGLHLLITSMLAYGLSRRELKYTAFLSFLVVFCLLFNGGLVPWYILIQRFLHLKDTVWALIVPYLVSSVNVLIMRNFFRTIPDSIIESARIDGAGEFKTFIQLVVPLSTPVFATIGLFVGVFFWNDWFTCALFIEKSTLYTLQFLLQSIMNNLEYLQGRQLGTGILGNLPSETSRMAACVLAVGPIILAYPFLQRFFVQGLTLGAVKQ